MARKSKDCLPFIGVGVLLLFGLAIAAVILVTSGRRTVAERIEAIRDRGEPTSLEELEAYYAAPDGANAAPVFLQAIATLNDLSREERVLLMDYLNEPVFPRDGETMPAGARAAVDAMLASHADTRALVAKAVGMGEARFSADFPNNADAILAQFSGMRQLVRFLVLDATANAQAGDADGAVESLLLAFGTLEAIADYPSLMGQLTRAAMLNQAVDGFVGVVNRVALSSEQLARLAEAMRASYSGASLRAGLIGERAYALSPDGPFDANVLLYMFDWPRLLDIYEQLIGVTDESLRDIVATLDALEAAGGKAQGGFLHPYTKIIVPPLLRAVHSHVLAATQLELALLVCVIERVRGETGSLPESLESAGIAAPADPYSGEGIRYVREADGYVVYSVGPDRKDGGGEQEATRMDRDTVTGDVLIRVSR